MLLEALVSVHDLGRLRDIAAVLVRYGFGDVLHRLGVKRLLSRAGHALHWKALGSLRDESSAVRFRRALEELGPTFAKLGQLLASRPDLLPPEWTKELSRLHQHVATVPFDELRPQLEADLGAAPESVFRDFATEPIAAGSIAQVHAATLQDGRPVVVKVRRPGIEETVAADLRLLMRLAQVVEHEGGELRRFRPRQVVREFRRTMRAELDLRLEAQNLGTVARLLGDRDDVVLPRVVERFTAERVLVMTRLAGVSAAEWLAESNPGDFDAKRVARTGADLVLRMVFGDGLFHADPHPGNVVFLPGGRIGLLDFGQVGRLAESRRLELVKLLGGVVDHDDDAIVDVLLGWSDGEGQSDPYALAEDVRAFVGRYEGTPLQELDVAAMLFDVTDIVRENALALPADVAILIKVFLTLEGLGRALDPQFCLSEHVEPAMQELVREITAPRAVLRRNARDVRRLLQELPGDLRTLITRVRRGQVRLELDLQRLDRFGQQIQRTGNRITVGTITAALIIGTAIATVADRGPSLWGWPVLSLLGFLCSAAVGLALLWSILRDR